MNLQTGNITPCITVDRPSLGNIFANTLDLYDAPGACPVSGIACVCDIHYQQSIVSGIDDSRAFQAQKRGYVDPATSAPPVASIASMALYQGTGMGIGTVQDTTRLFFTRDEVKQNWKSRRERRIDALGQWSVAATHSDGLAAIGIRLKNAQPLQHVEVFLNEAPDGSPTGAWKTIYSAPHIGSDLDLDVAAPVASRGLGNIGLR